MRKLVYLLVCLAVAVSAAAQTPQQRMSREQLAETQAKYIARELAFDDIVTRQFITIFCNCQKEVWAIGPRSGKDCSMQERFDRSQKLLDIRQKCIGEPVYSRAVESLAHQHQGATVAEWMMRFVAQGKDAESA